MAKVGRNESCPCGSGLKFKRCCGRVGAPSAPAQAGIPLPAFSPRSAERELAKLSRLIAGTDLRSAEELDDYIQRLMADDELPASEPATDLERAQDLMYQAWEAGDEEERIKLARQAVEISPDCADAYVLLAEEADTLEDATRLFRQGVEAAERALGPVPFAEDVGHFWGLLETRPYMRALRGLADCRHLSGDISEAIELARELLRLNPSDNQGVRHDLLGWLLEAGHGEQAGKLLGSHNDPTALWAYGRALHAFMTEGDSVNARDLLIEAVGVSIHPLTYLLGLKELPEHLPDLVELGDESEGIEVAYKQVLAWVAVPGALEWMVSTVEEQVEASRKVTRLRPRLRRK